MELKIGDSWEGITATITTEQAKDLLGALSNGTNTLSNNPIRVVWIGSEDADITYIEEGYEDYTQQYKDESLKELIKTIENELEG
jgi:hypothetical protein